MGFSEELRRLKDLLAGKGCKVQIEQPKNRRRSG
jgi:hypothetical protein